jgi:hypothetical protein
LIGRPGLYGAPFFGWHSQRNERVRARGISSCRALTRNVRSHVTAIECIAHHVVITLAADGIRNLVDRPPFPRDFNLIDERRSPDHVRSDSFGGSRSTGRELGMMMHLTSTRCYRGCGARDRRLHRWAYVRLLEGRCRHAGQGAREVAHYAIEARLYRRKHRGEF